MISAINATTATDGRNECVGEKRRAVETEEVIIKAIYIAKPADEFPKSSPFLQL